MADLEEAKSRLVRVSYHDAQDLKTNSAQAFSVNVPSYSSEFNEVLACQVQSVHLPHVFNNVDAYNKTFKFTGAGPTDYTITLTEGQYSLTQLLDELIVQIDALLGTSNSYSYNDITNKITLTLTEDFSITTDYATNPVAIMLGFGLSGTYSSTASALEAPYMPDLTGPSSVYIHCKDFSNGSYDLDTQSKTSIVVEVPLDQSFLSMVHYQATNDNSIIRYAQPRPINEIRLRVRNNRGQLLNLQEHDWSVLLKVWYLE